MRKPSHPGRRHLAGLLLAASLAGCSGGVATSNAPTAVKPPADANLARLQQLTGDAAIESGQVRVSVLDQTGKGLRVKTLPGVWTGANLRLNSANLTADRVVSIPAGSFTANSGACGNPNTATSCQTSSAVFSKLRPGSYLLQASVDNSTTSPTTVLAVQSVGVTVVGGATTNVIITLKLTSTGTTAITATSSGTETYPGGSSPASGNLSNSTTHPAADFAVLNGDVVNMLSPIQAADLVANTQDPSPSVSPGGGNGTPSYANGQLSRIVASIRAGSTTTVTTSTPQTNEKIVAIWYDTNNEARSNQPWATFYGSTVACGSLPTSFDTAGVVPPVCNTAAEVVSGLTGAVNITIPGTAAAGSGPNGTGVPGLTLGTTEAGTAADINAVLIYRFYDNTFEHRYTGFKVKTLVLDDAGAIQLTVN